VHREVGGLVHGLDRAICGRLNDDRALAAHPREDRGPICLIMAPAGLTRLAATTRAAPQGLCATLLGLALLARAVC
jgi:hypothetical protein